ncbi:MAG: hypothetical protein ACYS9Y_04880 [Planctomycetota bacterium]|jgi:hypothetical protein
MEEKDSDSNNHDISAEKRPQNMTSTAKKIPYRTLGIIFLLFFGFIAIVFLTQYSDTINWVEDYHAGVETAKQQKKPIFLAFYKSYIPINTLDGIYSNQIIKEFIEARFVPILIDASKHPEIAKLYNVSLYPTHYIKQPDSNEAFGPIGYRPPLDFIPALKGLMTEMGMPDE